MAMSDVVLSSGVRSNLLQLQQTADLIAETQKHLATGKRVNSALDNPTNFFTAQSLSGRANDLNALLDAIGVAQKTLEAASNGLTSITKLIQSAQAIVRQAQQTSDTAERISLASQFNQFRTQIDELAADSGFNGRNLLAGDTLTVTFNSDGSSTLSITGVNNTSAGDLAIAAGASWDDATAGDANIQTALDDLTAALATVRTQTKSFGSSLATVEARQDFTKAMINTLQSGADALTLADTNEEGANLLALQTRQQLSTTALSLAVQADQNVLRLFQ
jgi:flagellin-like hook-associated protein FlgL